MKSTKRIVLLGVLLALAVALSLLDGLISAVAFPFLPKIKIGLANLVVLIIILQFTLYESFTFAVLKSVLANLLFGGLISFAIGGSATLASYLIMVLLAKTLGKHLSGVGISVAGGVTHILTQLLVTTFIYKLGDVIAYYGALLVAISLVTSILVGLIVNKLVKTLNWNTIGETTMKIEKQIYNKIKAYDTIIIHRHKNPDGDAAGSQIGLKEAILATFPQKRVLITGDPLKRFAFLGTLDEVADADYENALVIVTDCSSTDIISDERYKLGKEIIRIDHHMGGEDFGDINYVVEDIISAASLIWRLVEANKMKLTPAGAKAIFTGIVTDSGRFSYRGVDAETFTQAAKLLAYDFALEDIYKELNKQDLAFVKLRAEMTMRFQISPGGVAYLKNTYQDVQKSGFDFFSISRGMVGVMANIDGIDIWANFTENEEGKVIAEFRSKCYDVHKIALHYGGGGHFLASGATLANFAEADEVIKGLEKIIKEGSFE